MNYLTYPFKKMRMTQGYYGKTSHLKHTQGTPKDYPWDEGAEDYGRNYLYCPCDEMEVAKIYQGNAKTTNAVWYRSTSPVVTPTFTDYVVLMVVHMNDDTLKGLYVDKKFKRHEIMGREGKDGATAYHFHLSIARGRVAGWQKSSNGAWVQSGDTKKPEECFYIDYSFSKMVNSQWIDFKVLPKIDPIVSKPVEPPKIEPVTEKPIEVPKEEPIIETPPKTEIKPIEEQTPKDEELIKEWANVEQDKPIQTTEPIKELHWLVKLFIKVIEILKGAFKK